MIARYWRERLEEVCPYSDKSYLEQPHNTILGDNKTWPRAVNVDAVYSDFLSWRHTRYVAPLYQNDIYKTNPSLIPKQPLQKHVLTILQGFQYSDGRSHTKLYTVSVPRLYQGTVFLERQKRRFICLDAWIEHVFTFEELTKLSVRPLSD